MGLHDQIYRPQKDTPKLAETEQRTLDELAEPDQDPEVTAVGSAG